MTNENRESVPMYKVVIIWFLAFVFGWLAFCNLPIWHDGEILLRSGINQENIVDSSLQSLISFCISGAFTLMVLFLSGKIPMSIEEALSFFNPKHVLKQGVPFFVVVFFVFFAVYPTIIGIIVFLIRFGFFEHFKLINYLPVFRSFNPDDYSVYSPYFFVLLIRLSLIIIFRNQFMSFLEASYVGKEAQKRSSHLTKTEEN